MPMPASDGGTRGCYETQTPGHGVIRMSGTLVGGSGHPPRSRSFSPAHSPGKVLSVSEQQNASFLHRPLGLSSGTLSVDCGQRGPDCGGRKETSDYIRITASATGQAPLRRHHVNVLIIQAKKCARKTKHIRPSGV